MPKAKLLTYHVTLYVVIAHTGDIRATTALGAERVAKRYWGEDGAVAFNSVALGQSAAGTTVMVQP